MGQQFYIDKTFLVVRLPKELDHHSAEQVRVEADKLTEENNIKTIIFDFNETSFMDSSGIGVIMGRYKNINFIGGKVLAVRVSSRVKKILTMSGLYKIIEIYENIPSGLESMIVRGGSV